MQNFNHPALKMKEKFEVAEGQWMWFQRFAQLGIEPSLPNSHCKNLLTLYKATNLGQVFGHQTFAFY